MKMNLKIAASATLALAAALSSQSTSSAAVFTLVDKNSTSTFDTGTQAGQFNWLVDGVNQISQQWFWFRVGNAPEASIDSLPIAAQGASDIDFNGLNDTLFTRYNGPGYTIQIRYGLSGGSVGSGSADLSEQIAIHNTGNTALDFHFFEYADFDLAGAADGDTAVFTNPNTVYQSKNGVTLAETVITPPSSHRELGIFPSTLNKLNDGVADNLNDTPVGQVFGPGDVTWAYQWDVSIPAGSTFQISKDKNLSQVVPEPTTAALAVVGLALYGGNRRRR